VLPACKGRPFTEVLLVNGPGTCVTLVLAAYLSRVGALRSLQ
jgi:beta-1,4-N-acetylglucosaminyltransferase